MVLAREVGAILAKEIRTEWRTRVALSGVGLFLIGALTLIGIGLNRVPLHSATSGALLWVVLLFTAATGLGRAFVQEAERGTALALRLHADPSAVWLGKFAFNVLLLWALAAIAAPGLLGMLQVAPESVNVGILICVLGVGTLAVAAVFTTMAALVAQTTARGGLLAALAFPLLIPAFQSGLNGTKAALGVGFENIEVKVTPWQVAYGDLGVLTLYTATAIWVSLWLFDYVWND